MFNIYTEIVIGCWAAFILYWFFSAFMMKRTLNNPAWGMGILLRVGILAAVIIVLHFTAPTVTFRPSFTATNPVWGSIGSVFAVFGVSLAIWARYTLGANWGMPMSVKEKPDLITNGPYSLVRHPIYTGVILGMLGTAMVIGFWWLIVFFVAIIYFLYSAKKEEQLMAKEFPEGYPTYKKRTWALIPLIY